MPKNKVKEKWEHIPGYRGLYKVSNKGRVKSVNRIITTSNGRKVKLKGKLLKQYIDSQNYCSVQLCKNGAPKRKDVHILVLLSFKGKCPKGMECCHNDGNPLNNRISNLRYDTRKGNLDDKYKHGTAGMGEGGSGTKLSVEEVLKIRKLYKTGKYTYSKLAKKFNIDTTTVGYIIRNETWRNIDKDGNELDYKNYRKAKKIRNAKIINAFGEELTIAEWSEKLNIPKTTLSRRIKDGWTPEEALTKEKAKRFKALGKNLTLREWERKTGISYDTLLYRIRNGWSIEEALTTKPKYGNKRE